MTSLIGVLILVSALTATSSALQCTTCNSTSSTCSGYSKTCPSGEVCGSIYTQGLAVGVRSETLLRGCVPSSQCNFNGSMSIKEGGMVVSSSCCDTDYCTPALPTFPTKSPNPNGVICRSCFSAQSAWCDTSDTIQCTGDENMCLLETTEIPGLLSTALRGCATKSICDVGSQSTTAGGSTTKVSFTCTSGGIRAHKVFLTPAIVCLLLLKLFL